MSELLWITPVFKEMVWGGDRLHTKFHYEIPGGHTGECWAISAHPSGDCKILNGTYEGYTLSGLWKSHGDLFGHYGGDRFPLLIKIIDAKQDLSIQVHPDASYAKAHENWPMGKRECWYILDCDEDAKIVIGHHARTHEEMERMIREKRWQEFLREVPIKKGDFFQINPGCVHAIKGGTLILETQQNSDITYRVYDYDRLSDGKPRELHVRQSIDTIKTPFEAEESVPVALALDGAVQTHFISCPSYSVDKYDVNGNFQVEFSPFFTNVSILDGTGSVDGKPLKKGDNFIIPCGYGLCEFRGNFSMICSSPEVETEKSQKTEK